MLQLQVAWIREEEESARVHDFVGLKKKSFFFFFLNRKLPLQQLSFGGLKRQLGVFDSYMVAVIGINCEISFRKRIKNLRYRII